MWKSLVCLAVAGAAGTLCRYGLASAVQRFSGGRFPWGTLAVNVLGCLLFGLVWSLADERQLISRQTRTVLLVGFLGAFTTFSTFAFETAAFADDRRWLSAAGNVLLQNMAGILAVFIGLWIGRDS